MKKAEGKNQRAVVVYKKGHTGERSAPAGLGYSQMKEVTYLQLKYPKYKEAGGFKEIDASEFEAENAMNRAQIYESATQALIVQQGKAWGAGLAVGAEVNFEDVGRFLENLAYHTHTMQRVQFRLFEDDFVRACTPPLLVRVWATLRPLVVDSKFPLIAWQPSPKGDEFVFVHLSFQEFYCAKHLLRTMQERPEPRPKERKRTVEQCEAEYKEVLQRLMDGTCTEQDNDHRGPRGRARASLGRAGRTRA